MKHIADERQFRVTFSNFSWLTFDVALGVFQDRHRTYAPAFSVNLSSESRYEQIGDIATKSEFLFLELRQQLVA